MRIQNEIEHLDFNDNDDDIRINNSSSVKTFFSNLPQNILELQNNLWSSVKSGNLSVNSKQTERQIYTVSACVGAGVVLFVACYFVKKKLKSKEQDLSDLYEQN